jgi:hypothetical protein
MYYLLITGRIVTEHDMRTAYEICNGSAPDVHPGHYEKWLNTVIGVESVMQKDEVTVEQLVRGDCKHEAIKKYRAIHLCGLREAKEAIDKM